MMSRKDYVAIAAVIKGSFEAAPSEAGKNAIRHVTNGITGVLRADNLNFDAQRFYAACGLETAGKG